jgi:anti-sigma factor RsiW
MSPEPREPDERRLWERYVAATSGADGAPATPDELELAAYLDGRASPEAMARVERWLEHDPTAPATIRELRSLLAREQASPMLVPPAVMQKATTLVSEPSRAEISVLTRSLGRVAGWSLAAAAMVAVATVGYHGGTLAAPVAADSADLATELSFGLTNDAILTDTDVLWPPVQEGTP